MNGLLLTSSGLLAIMAGSGVLAQSSTAQAPAQKPSTGVVATVTATGCLERWNPETMASPTETPDQAPAGVEYVLTNVEGDTASATAAGAGKATKAQPETRYLLLTSPSSNYAPHLNHKVTIAGTIAPQPSEGASESDRVADPTTRETNLPASPKSEAYQYNLVDVASITMVSRSCGRK